MCMSVNMQKIKDSLSIFADDPDYIEGEIKFMLFNLRVDFQLLLDPHSRMKSFINYLDMLTGDLNNNRNHRILFNELTNIFHTALDSRTIMDRIYYSMCKLNELLKTEGFAKLNRKRKHAIYSEIKNTISDIKNMASKLENSLKIKYMSILVTHLL